MVSFGSTGVSTCHVPIHLVTLEVGGHVTAVRFWGSTERGPPAISIIKHLSVGGPHSAPQAMIIVGRKIGLNLREWEGGKLKI